MELLELQAPGVTEEALFIALLRFKPYAGGYKRFSSLQCGPDIFQATSWKGASIVVAQTPDNPFQIHLCGSSLFVEPQHETHVQTWLGQFSISLTKGSIRPFADFDLALQFIRNLRKQLYGGDGTNQLTTKIGEEIARFQTSTSRI